MGIKQKKAGVAREEKVNVKIDGNAIKKSRQTGENKGIRPASGLA